MAPVVLPGAARGPSGGLYAWLLDGSYDAAGAQELHPDDFTVLDYGTAVIRVAVGADGLRAGPAAVLAPLRATRGAERAERAARAEADRWHLEEYRFAGWDNLPWSRSRTARYRLCQVRRVVAQLRGRRWELAAGPVVADRAGATVRERVVQAQWSAKDEELRQAGAVFDRLTAEFAGSPLDEALDGHRAAVVAARQRARDLVRLGQEVSRPAVGADPVQLRDISDRLAECRRVVVDAARQVSKLRLHAIGHTEASGPEVAERLAHIGSALAELNTTAARRS